MINPLIDLTDRTIIVTGAAGGGIGTATVELLLSAGAQVIAVSRSEQKLQDKIEPLVRRGAEVIPVVADIRNDAGIDTVMDAANKASGSFYGLVNVAGGASADSWMRAERVTRDDWRQLFADNLETMFFMSRAVAASLKQARRPGAIVSVSSISGMNTASYHIAYGTAKAAVAAATRTLALELALDDIRVNAVAPGTTLTPGAAAYIDDDEERDRAAIAQGRRAEPLEQAGPIAFLLSDLSSYITGQTILVDGGLNLKWSHLAPDNTSLFLKDQNFRRSIQR